MHSSHIFRALAQTPLTTSQVNSINNDITALTTAGIKDDTISNFREFGVIYHRLLERIPAGNPSKDSPAQQAARYIQATIKGRHQVGMQLMHHFSVHGVNQNDPAAVRDSIIAFLEEQAAVHRLCQPPPPTTVVPPSPAYTLPDITDLRREFSELKSMVSHVSLVNAKDPVKHHLPPTREWRADRHWPCAHCGGEHFNNNCQDAKAGTRAYFKKHHPAAPKTRTVDGDNALINAAFEDLASLDM